MPVSLVALKPHRYNGKLWRKGQVFDALLDDARVLTAIGFAAHAPIGGETPRQPEDAPVKRPRGRPRKVQTVQTYETREMVAAEPAEPEPIDTTPLPSED